AGTGDEGYVSLVEHVVVPRALAYRPSLIPVSAGFDAHHADPLAECEVTDAGYAAMAASVARVAAELGVPVGVVLEGGYDLGAVARGVRITLEAFGGAGAAPDVPLHPLAAAALAR